jgi:sugar lactone lactonase YvrE
MRCCLKLILTLGGINIMVNVAGDGSQSDAVDGILATSSSVAEPTGTAIDADGNIYIADGLHHRIRLVTKSTGIMTTFAGTGEPAFSGDGGLATAAALNLPRAVVLDSAGNLYIADTNNHRIRKVTKSTGFITTVAGTGVAGFSEDGILATLSKLFSPNGVAVDAEDNLFIADTYNHRVRKVTLSTGIISAVAGDGFQGLGGELATNAGLYYPFNIALDTDGNVYIADSYDNAIRKVTKKTGFISTIVGAITASGSAPPGFSGDNGDAKLASLNTPTGLAVDAGGNIFIADFVNNAIRLWTKDTGIITTVAGRGDSLVDGSDATAFKLNGPVNVNISPSGTLYISDTNANYIRSFTPKVAPTSAPTASPSLEPTPEPTSEPSEGPTIRPSRRPTSSPTAAPTDSPVFSPTKKPSNSPTEQPTYYNPTFVPTDSPAMKGSKKPTMSPSVMTNTPTVKQSSRGVTESPSTAPNTMPTNTKAPALSSKPTKAKCPCRIMKKPTCVPTVSRPTKMPTPKRPRMGP